MVDAIAADCVHWALCPRAPASPFATRCLRCCRHLLAVIRCCRLWRTRPALRSPFYYLAQPGQQQQAGARGYQLMYVAPERLLEPRF